MLKALRQYDDKANIVAIDYDPGASSVNQLAKCWKPMLFIHGNADPLVPVWMAQTCYDAKVVGYRELWIAEGSGHSWAYPDHPAEYVARVRSFLLREVE